MKRRNLLMMSSLFALALGVASCSSGDDVAASSPLEKAQQNVNTYGTRSTELNVYFGNDQMTLTRAATKPNSGWPEWPTEAEKQGVLDYVRKNKDASVAWPGYTTYYVQNVTAAHNKYSYDDTMNPGNTHTISDATSHMDKLMIKENNGKWEHVLDFNAGKNDNSATHGATLMTAGFKSAEYHETNGTVGDGYYENWRLYYYEGNYYLAFDYETHKQDGGVDADGIYDDWIVKIIRGAGETEKTPDDKGDPVIPDTAAVRVVTPEVEFDIHQQEHKDWNEIKTSIHVRDTAAVRVFLPIPYEYQAVADDFDIRSGKDYAYIEYTENVSAKFTFANQEFEFPVQINHQRDGIEILVDCSNAQEALKLARGVYADGITFEVHSYVIPSAEPEQIWDWLKNVTLPGTKTSQWPTEGDICTHTFGQVTSAYYPKDGKQFDAKP